MYSAARSVGWRRVRFSRSQWGINLKEKSIFQRGNHTELPLWIIGKNNKNKKWKKKKKSFRWTRKTLTRLFIIKQKPIGISFFFLPSSQFFTNLYSHNWPNCLAWSLFTKTRHQIELCAFFSCSHPQYIQTIFIPFTMSSAPWYVAASCIYPPLGLILICGSHTFTNIASLGFTYWPFC